MGDVVHIAAYASRLYVGTEEGIEVVDVQGPARVGTVAGGAFAAYRRLYVANGHGFDIWDTSSAVTLRGSYTAGTAGVQEGMKVIGNKLFYQPDVRNTTLLEVDVSMPDEPTLVQTHTLQQVPHSYDLVDGEVVTAGALGVYVGDRHLTLAQREGSPSHVAVSGLKVVILWNSSLLVYDTAANPAEVWAYQLMGPAEGLVMVGGMAYVTLQTGIQEVRVDGKVTMTLYRLPMPSGSLCAYGSAGYIATNITYVTRLSLPGQASSPLLPRWAVILLMCGAVLIVCLLSCCMWGALGSAQLWYAKRERRSRRKREPVDV
eukprot:TRINITY_DN1798_c1_g1_i1.p1 TRINITY_DN1798_c1_g1~~TRINITY_DN1798_c1_g1_i1.p1  ORF type:complete len:350 (+),score=83.08 TRINITY_DN1798_c1_g1_i1:100-1050(+)